MILTSGRLVEYEGGGDETRSNPWLAELQQDMFVEMNPFDANGKNIRNGDMVWVKTPEGAQIKVMAQVTLSVLLRVLPSCHSTLAVIWKVKIFVPSILMVQILMYLVNQPTRP